jgi:hypothetical protein
VSRACYKDLGIGDRNEEAALSTWLRSGRQGMLSWENIIHTPPPISLKSILILSSHLRLGFPNGLFPSVLPPFQCSSFQFPIVKPEVKGRPLGWPGMIILKWILINNIWGCGLDSSGSGQGPVTSLVNVVVNIGFKTTRNFISLLSDYQLPKKDCVPWLVVISHVTLLWYTCNLMDVSEVWATFDFRWLVAIIIFIVFIFDISDSPHGLPV